MIVRWLNITTTQRPDPNPLLKFSVSKHFHIAVHFVTWIIFTVVCFIIIYLSIYLSSIDLSFYLLIVWILYWYDCHMIAKEDSCWHQMWIWLMFGWSWSPCAAVSFDWGLVLCSSYRSYWFSSTLSSGPEWNGHRRKRPHLQEPVIQRFICSLFTLKIPSSSWVWLCVHVHARIELSFLSTSCVVTRHSVHFIASAHALKL